MEEQVLRFILVRGVLAWGIGAALVFSAIQALQHQQVEALNIAKNIGMFMTAGVVWGAAVWRWKVRKK